VGGSLRVAGLEAGALVGTTTAPADPPTISAAAETLFDAAATSSGCSTPLIALNELNGASTTTPWTTTNARHRQNVPVLGFQSGPGAGGREGLRPSSTWFRYAKLNTLAAKRVAGEFGVATVWTWGWRTSSASGADPDKEAAACVYLWTRDPALCDGPGAAGPDFDASRTEGQIALPPGIQCSLDGRLLRQTDLSHMTRSRTTETSPSPCSTTAWSRAGSPGFPPIASRRRSRRSSTGCSPAGSRAAYSGALARTSGSALAAAAPAALFRLPAGGASPFTTGLGSCTVTPLGGALPLGAVPYVNARAAIRTALVSFARTQAYEDGARKRAESALNRTICLRDDLPSPALVSVSTYLPFLALNS
jgi:hypothetical protein